MHSVTTKGSAPLFRVDALSVCGRKQPGNPSISELRSRRRFMENEVWPCLAFCHRIGSEIPHDLVLLTINAIKPLSCVMKSQNGNSEVGSRTPQRSAMRGEEAGPVTGLLRAWARGDLRARDDL